MRSYSSITDEHKKCHIKAGADSYQYYNFFHCLRENLTAKGARSTWDLVELGHILQTKQNTQTNKQRIKLIQTKINNYLKKPNQSRIQVANQDKHRKGIKVRPLAKGPTLL